MMFESKVDRSFLDGLEVDLDFTIECDRRRNRYSDNRNWNRRFPILSVLAPALSNYENKIEFPGDPMCLYHALSVAIHDAVESNRQGFVKEATFNDNCPSWKLLPDDDYRLKYRDRKRSYHLFHEGQTDASIFDPRVWNQTTERYFRHLLRYTKPRVLLISTVSPAYRYAARIAIVAKEELPTVIVVMGGRHIDETIKIRNNELVASESSVLVDMCEGDLPQVVDIVVSGEAYDALSIVLQAISLALPIPWGYETIPMSSVISRLRQLARTRKGIRGNALIGVVDNSFVTAFPVSGKPVDFNALPSPYAAFGIRARFPIFLNRSGQVARTAHMMASGKCPFDCYFCSESRSASSVAVFRGGDIESIAKRFVQLIKWNAEAVFFDDSVFLSGSKARIVDFCRCLTAMRCDENIPPEVEWGAQLTIGIVEELIRTGDASRMFQSMADAGCTYIYFGLESLAGSIVAGVQKSQSKLREDRWVDRVTRALTAVKSANIRAGASVLFGLEGESTATVEETISEVEKLLSQGLLCIVSPNLMTYHPGTEITKRHGRENRLKFSNAELGEFIRPPYSYFEEAFPGMVSRELTEELIWYIHNQTQARWKSKRNMNAMEAPMLEDFTGYSTEKE